MHSLLPYWKYCAFLPLLTLAGICAGAPTQGNSGQRPNFVVIILDDWGWRESGAYGNKEIQTPNIDRLASQGVQFHNAFLTASTCTSSRASILTGLHPFAAGSPRLHVPIPADRKLVTHYLNQAGYFTASVGKGHIGEDVMRQFDLVINERPTQDESQTGSEDWVSTIETKLPRQRPFFLWLAAKDAHRPWHADPRWSIHKPESIKLPGYIETNSKHTPEYVRNEMAMYYDEIYRADFYIGEVVKSLEKKKLLDNTVIILMSDNGSPFWRAKKFLTDAGLKTPFIVYWPAQIKQHSDINELISAVDIAPTLLELAGITTPTQMEGRSFAAWLTDRPKAIHEFVYGERGDGLLGSENGRSIRDKKYLYIVDDYRTYTECEDKNQQNITRREYLFDVVNDPDNVHNLVPPENKFRRLFDRLTGKRDYSNTLAHYRQLMEQRRIQRNDLPEATIKGSCPRLWWQETPATTGSRAPSSD